MLFLVHARLNPDTRAICSGLPDARHYDMLAALTPLLKKLGDVRRINCPYTEADAIHAQASAEQRPCLLLSFSLPHHVPVGLACPTIAVFDWGYDTVPDHAWQDEPRHDWLWVLSQLSGVITGSHYSASVLRSAAARRGISLPLAVVPWQHAELPVEPAAPRWLDSQLADWSRLAPALFTEPPAPEVPASASRWQRGVRRLLTMLRQRTEWTSPSIPQNTAPPDSSFEARSANRVPRSSFALWREQLIQPWLRSAPPTDLKGIIYTATQNPLDHHNLYHDLITAFCDAFKEHDDVTLVLHLEHRDGDSALHPYLEELYRLHPFRCRVVICIGEPLAVWWQQLANKSHYHVHISRGDGSCPRLLQMMQAGRPAVTSQATAMGDVARPANSFIVDSGREPTWWPHDERGLLRATHIRLDWRSLRQAFTDSYRIASRQPDLYRQMSVAAQQAASALLDTERAVEQIGQLVERIQLVQASRQSAVEPGTTSPDASTHKAPDSKLTGLADIVDHGWFNNRTRELCAGFPIHASDRVLDFGCGTGAATLFCANIGAHVTFTDSDLPKLETLARQVRQSIAQSWRGFLSEGLPLPMAEASVNRVICMEVLEHLEDPLSVLQELVRVGEPGALYLLTVPEARAERVQQKLAPATHFAAPNHIQVFDRDSFNHMVRSSGLHIESTQSMSFYWALWFCFYWASQRPGDHNSEMPTLDQIQAPYPAVTESWAETWRLIREHDGDNRLRNALDNFMPKAQVVIARKPDV